MENQRNKAIVFMFPDVATEAISELNDHRVPRERLYGFYELREREWKVAISNSRWEGYTSKIRIKFGRFIQIPSIKTLKEWRKCDFIIVKDEFSIILTITAKIMGKKIVYLDSMFRIPIRVVNEIAVKVSIVLADAIICFSNKQATLWARKFCLPIKLFSILPYSMDCDFYSITTCTDFDKPYIISVGRDIGRDFITLVNVLKFTNIKIKIVTLPYLIPKIDTKRSNIEIFERLNYAELFNLYSGACAAVVPIKFGVDYPSGIRAVMEAMLLGVPVVASNTPVLCEYFENERNILFVEPGDPEAIVFGINRLKNDKKLRNEIIINARRKVMDLYNMNVYTDMLESILFSI